MANQTLIGCVNFATGQVIFDQGICEYAGCMIWSGTHAGQVAVTIGVGGCDDIYYGCVNFASGTFSVIVPAECCTFIPGQTALCVPCFDPFKAPNQYNVTIADVDVCPLMPGAVDGNGVYILDIINVDCCTGTEDEDCGGTWFYEEEESVRVSLTIGRVSSTQVEMVLIVSTWADEIPFVSVPAYHSFFQTGKNSGFPCSGICEGSGPNVDTLCNFGPVFYDNGKDGTGSWSPVCEDCCNEL